MKVDCKKTLAILFLGNNVCQPVTCDDDYHHPQHTASLQRRTSSISSTQRCGYHAALARPRSSALHFSFLGSSMPDTLAGFFFFRKVACAFGPVCSGSYHKRHIVPRAMSTPTFHLSISSHPPCLILLTHTHSGRAPVRTLRLFQETREAPQLDPLLIS